MIKLVCTKCGQAWYTADTRSSRKCSACDGLLIEEDLDVLKSKDISIKHEPEDNSKAKVTYVNW